MSLVLGLFYQNCSSNKISNSAELSSIAQDPVDTSMDRSVVYPKTLTDPCSVSGNNLKPGTKCLDGNFYIGSLTDSSGKLVRYMTTPGGCKGPAASAQCTGGIDSLQLKWRDGATTSTYANFSIANPISPTIIDPRNPYKRTYLDVNSGSSNTTNIMSLNTNNLKPTYPAVSFCADLKVGGHDDWFLPNTQEMNLLYNNASTSFGLVTNGHAADPNARQNSDFFYNTWYWTSSMAEKGKPFVHVFSKTLVKNTNTIDFPGGTQYGYADSGIYFVRCVRTF